MALKTKITAAEHAALADNLKSEYKLVGTDYLLETDDLTELRNAKDREVQARKDAEAERDRLKAEKDAADAEVQAAKDEAARKKGDVAAIETSWQAKLEAAKVEGEAKAAKLQTQLDNLLVANKAKDIANEISTTPDLIEPLIAARLKAETEGDVAITRVLDANGKPSAMSLDDLKKEFIANPRFAVIIKGSGGQGGGAGADLPGGGAPGAKKISEMTFAERTAAYNADPAAFNTRLAAEKGTQGVSA